VTRRSSVGCPLAGVACPATARLRRCATIACMAEVEAGRTGRGPSLTGWMVVAIVAIVALAAVGITALVTRPSTTPVPATSTTKPKPALPTTTIPVATTTSTAVPPPTTGAPPPSTTPSATAAVVVITRGGQVVWQTGQPLNDSYYCCFPPGPDGIDRSGSAGCSGSLASGFPGTYTNGRLC
jgi:hypothetical protein